MDLVFRVSSVKCPPSRVNKGQISEILAQDQRPKSARRIGTHMRRNSPGNLKSELVLHEAVSDRPARIARLQAVALGRRCPGLGFRQPCHRRFHSPIDTTNTR